MQTQFHNKHFITLQEWTKEEIDTLLDVSFELKRHFAMGVPTPYLSYKTIFLMFFEQSTRTRNSMEAGIAQLGGHANYLDTSTMQIAHGESAKDTAIILSRFGHGIACRNCFWGIGNKYLREMAQWATVPVINLQCDLYHPMQVLADLMTIKEKVKDTQRLKVSIIWAYATTHKKPISVPLSQILLFPRYGMDVTLAYPEGYDLPDWAIKQAEENAKANGGSLRITHNQEEAYEGAHVVIPKNWGDWVTNPDPAVINPRLEANKHWKCTEKMMSLADPDVMYMHALPADRKNEVEDSVIDGPHSIVYDEAENRIHTAKAVMTLTMGGK
ncbi:MAG TPA: ornithine carbamoyltransferase [Acetomicrobium flavidum]|uniref:Ornithine carbamoyltransferase n=2 Tax=Acetomicrobium TaxID=49894 RepID=I4BXG1_ACEMN|nr:ornithine carbamoyltransferase [Acetomicrobium mobile]NLG94571.1 ornithine carbamoyltransferase [Acetomicrobium flavidum]AFM21968.1 ornithine carbamoyltransferase [Acetomicrobium mobile DSM 13181]SIN76647.1 ornithine carbamoyltransferase [Acetomicrobium flavidum]HOJ82311.1 ornithine carbamoyltransferase [Acetomicrobium flavidum]HOM31373.1 ornithine carbamoyltransferase [Acetomicrobium flavidum]